MQSLMWFRRDLRLHDNKALYHAVKESDSLVALFFLTPDQWRQHHECPEKISFWKACLSELGQDLTELGIELVVVEVPSFAEIPARIVEIARQRACGAVYYNCEYEHNEKKRDYEITRALKIAGIKTRCFHDRILIEPGRILTGSGGFYTVFTPFCRSWLGVAQLADLKPLPIPEKKFKPLSQFVNEDLVAKKTAGWRSDLWPAGEKAAQQRLQKFVSRNISSYHEKRDLPGVDGTSLLSPWLTAGSISPRHCLDALSGGSDKAFPSLETGPGVWLNELIWRDFYCHVMVGFPRVSRSLPFKAKTASIPWSYDEAQLTAWKNGRTGYPLVDAAMRQLRQTGWMHNR